MFNPVWYTNSQWDGFAILEFFVPDNESRRFVPLRTTHLSGSVLGPFAEFALTHTFRFSRDDCPRTIEALYRFPLPGDAAVTGVTVTFGQTVITAMLKVRVEAEKEYEDAKKEGKAAALLSRESRNVFTLRIAGIAPDEDVVIRTGYVQIGEPEGTGFTFRIPLTTPPRYVRDDERLSRAMQAQPLAVLRDPGHRFSLELIVPGNGTLSSPSHSLKESEGVYVLSSCNVIPDQDCILDWKPMLEDDRPLFQVYSDDVKQPHFLALITPPMQTKTTYPRELTVLIDHSGSMEGSKWAAANLAGEQLLKSLGPGDYFNLCLFESVSYWLWKEPGPASRTGVDEALRFLADKRSGGTELGVALEQAVRQPRRDGEIARHVIIITDAQVTDEGRILQLVKREREQKNARRCSILCIDSAPNTGFANAIARYGRGVVRFLTSSAGERDIAPVLDDLVSLWNAPIAINLSLTVNHKQVFVPDRTVWYTKEGSATIDLGDLVPGRSVWLYGRCGEGDVPCSFVISRPGVVVQVMAGGTNPSVRYLYGANVVASLDLLIQSGRSFSEIREELSILGYELPKTEDGMPPVYHENAMEKSRTWIKELLVRESLAYGIASSETAFIAVRKDADRVVEESAIVANALPDGWSGNFIKSSGPMCISNSGGPMSMIMQPDGTLGTRHRKTRDLSSGGLILEWSGGGGAPIQSRRSIPGDSVKPIKGEGDTYILPPKEQSGPGLISVTLFKGRAVFKRGEAVLFDSQAKGMHNMIPRGFHVKKIIFSSSESRPEFMHLRLMLFIGDMVRQVIDIPLSELEAKGGEVSVFATRKHGAIIRLLLMDVSETNIIAIPEMTVTLEGEIV